MVEDVLRLNDSSITAQQGFAMMLTGNPPLPSTIRIFEKRPHIVTSSKNNAIYKQSVLPDAIENHICLKHNEIIACEAAFIV